MQLTQSLLLDALPDSGRDGITTAQIREKLQSRGIETTWLKTMRRALQRLEGEGLAYSVHQGRHLYWWRRPGVGGIGAGAQKRMGLGEALALRMLDIAAQAYQLPWVVRSELSSMFSAARLRLEKTPIGDAHKTWENRVAVLDEGFSRLPPPIKTDVAEIVSMALFKTLSLSMRYSNAQGASQGGKTSRRIVVEPLGWVSRNKLHYLVARKPDTDQIRHYRIDRIQSAELGQPFFYPGDFSLKQYLEDEAPFDYPGQGKKTTILLKFKRDYGVHLLATPINETQMLAADTAESITIRFEAWNSERLLWWIRGFGPNVEVLAPLDLRTTLQHDAEQTVEIYTIR